MLHKTQTGVSLAGGVQVSIRPCCEADLKSTEQDWWRDKAKRAWKSVGPALPHDLFTETTERLGGKAAGETEALDAASALRAVSQRESQAGARVRRDLAGSGADAEGPAPARSPARGTRSGVTVGARATRSEPCRARPPAPGAGGRAAAGSHTRTPEGQP